MLFTKIALDPLKRALLLAVMVVILVSGHKTQAQVPDLVIDVIDTVAAPGQLNSVISVFMDNFEDTVVGFNLWLQLDRPDIMIFQNDSVTIIDTLWMCTNWVPNPPGSTCTDSIIDVIDTIEAVIGNFDTTGTLISGWQYVDARSLSGLGFDINIVALADDPFMVGAPPGIAPQQGGLLIKIVADIFSIEDTAQDRTVNILIQHEFIDHFSFSRPDGTSIGIFTQQVPDTSYFRCMLWCGADCCNWQKVSLPPYDSLFIDTIDVAVLDTTKVILLDGSVTVTSGFVCGNINGSLPPADLIDISDLTYLVQYMFGGGPEPIPLAAANVNCDPLGDIDISDLTYFVNFMFGGGPLPCASCP